MISTSQKPFFELLFIISQIVKTDSAIKVCNKFCSLHSKWTIRNRAFGLEIGVFVKKSPFEFDAFFGLVEVRKKEGLTKSQFECNFLSGRIVATALCYLCRSEIFLDMQPKFYNLQNVLTFSNCATHISPKTMTLIWLPKFTTTFAHSTQPRSIMHYMETSDPPGQLRSGLGFWRKWIANAEVGAHVIWS